MKWILTICLAVLVPPHALRAEEPVRLGVVQSLSGREKSGGENILNAIQLAAEEIRSSKTPPVEVYVEDDKGTSAGAQAAYDKLKAAKVDLILGPSNATAVKSLLAPAARDSLPIFTTAVAPQELKFSNSKDLLFTNAMTLSAEIAPFKLFMSRLSLKKIAVIRETSDWSHLRHKLLMETVTAMSYEVVDDISDPGSDENKIGKLLSRIKDKKPQVIVLLLPRDDIDRVLRVSDGLKYRVPFFSPFSGFDAFRASARQALYEHLCMSYPYKQLQADGSFYSRFMRRAKVAPQIFANNSYDAVYISWLAVKVARSKGVPVERVLRELQYDGISGKYSWTLEGSFAVGQSSLVCILNGYPAVTE